MKKPLLIAVAVVLVGSFVAIAGYRIQSSVARNASATGGAAREVPTVAVITATGREMPQAVAITGVVRAQNEAHVFAKMPGRVTRVTVEVGQMVKAGEVLAVLESIDFAWRVKLAEAQLAAARAGLANAEVQKKQATSGWDRAQALRQKGAVSQVDFEQADTGFALAKVGVDAALAQVALAEANVGLSAQALADTRITAPIAGVLAKRNVDVGALAGPQMPAFVVQDQSALKMVGTVPASDVAHLHKGTAVTVTVDELPGRELEGTLAFVAPTLEAESRRASVEVSLKPAEGLLPYMFGHAQISFGERREVVVIPASAVITGADGPTLYVVRHGKAVLVRPQLGARVGDEVIVLGGVQHGESVITSGDTGLSDGAPVNVAGS